MGEGFRYAVGLDATVERLRGIWRAEGREAMRRELMAKQSPTFKDFNPTGDARVALIKGKTDELIGLVRDFTGASGPGAQRRAALAATSYEQAWMWAERAFAAEDFVEGDEPGAGQVGP